MDECLTFERTEKRGGEGSTRQLQHTKGSIKQTAEEIEEPTGIMYERDININVTAVGLECGQRGSRRAISCTKRLI